MNPARNRETWVDVAKGVAILLVVLFHAGGYVPASTTAGSAWEQVNVVLVSVRMPLFFLVSGLFISKALVSQPARRYFRNKPWPPLYLFVLWTSIFAVLYAVSDGAFGESVVRSLLLDTTLWYMAGLAVHMSVAWVIRGLPPKVQIGGAAVLALPFAVFFPFELGGLAHIPNYFVFFLLGCHGRQALTGLVKEAGRRRTGMLLATCIGLLGVAVVLRKVLPEIQELQAVILFALLPLAAVPFALICCHAIAAGRAGGWLSWLGRHTLPVFLLHPLALQLIDLLGASALSEQSLLAWVMPLVLSVGALGISVLAWHLLEMHAPFLFGPTRHSSGRHGSRRAAAPEPVEPRPRARADRQPSWAADLDDATPLIGLARTPPAPRRAQPPPPAVRPRVVPTEVPSPRLSPEVPGRVPATHALRSRTAPRRAPVPEPAVNGARRA